MRISLIQTELHWHNAVANRKMFTQKIKQLPETDVIILPEMFTTGFSMEAPELAEEMSGETLPWLKQMASETDAAVTGSVIIQENGNFYNRLFWVFPDGTHQQYDKRHLFRMAGEHHVYAGGQERLIVEWKGWKICPMVCYDLRFPVWSRNTDLAYDILLYVANWPERRRLAWQSLLRARAIENQCYCIGVNRVGTDGNGHPYSGDSGVYSPLGEELFHAEYIEANPTVALSKQELEEYREKFPAYLDADSFTIQ